MFTPLIGVIIANYSSPDSSTMLLVDNGLEGLVVYGMRRLKK